MMTCVSERSGIASSVIFLIDHTPKSVAIPMKRSTMNLLCAQASMILLIMVMLLRFLLMLRAVCRFGLRGSLSHGLMLGMIHGGSLRRCRSLWLLLWLLACASAMIHPRRAHSTCGRFQFALGIDQEIA